VKRVLNSGSIKLPYITGSEKDLEKDGYKVNELSDAWMENYVAEKLLDKIKFTFEIKMPVLVAQTFYNDKLGTLTVQGGPDHPIAYLPQQYFKESPLGTNIMDSKACNDYNTKLNNFYNWAFNFYNKLIEGGMNPAQAELVLPQGLFKNYLWEVNAKDLISFIEQNHGQSPELRGYCSTLVLYMEDHLPNVTAYLKRNQWKDLI
jgi:thymidylate synthase ThyX